MKLRALSALAVLAMLVVSCGEDMSSDIDLTNFREDFVSCLHDDGALIFRTDEGVLLYPEKELPTDLFSTGQRAIIGYVPTTASEVGEMKISLETAIRPIPFAAITALPSDSAALLPDDPIYLASVWYGGGCINLRYQIEYYHALHTLAMVAALPQRHSDTLDVRLHYDRGGDTTGYYRSGYASFLLPEPLPANVRVRINTSNLGGENDFVFTLK